MEMAEEMGLRTPGANGADKMRLRPMRMAIETVYHWNMGVTTDFRRAVAGHKPDDERADDGNGNHPDAEVRVLWSDGGGGETVEKWRNW